MFSGFIHDECLPHQISLQRVAIMRYFDLPNVQVDEILRSLVLDGLVTWDKRGIRSAEKRPDPSMGYRVGNVLELLRRERLARKLEAKRQGMACDDRPQR